MNRVCGFALLTLMLLADSTSGQVLLSTYLGGPGADQMTGARVLSDGAIVVGGTMPGGNLGTSVRVPAQQGVGDGILIRLSADAERVLSVTRLEGSVVDLDADAQDNIYVTGSSGSVKLSPKTGKRFWTISVGGAEARIAAARNGCAAVLAGKKITLVGPDGATRESWEVGADRVNDVACDPKSDLTFVTGFHNRWGTPPGQKSYPVQMAFVYAFDEEGNKVWGAYDWKGQEVADLHLMADTRGYRLAMGGDGKLYVAGESAGGNTMWSRQSQNLQAELPLAKGDQYQVAYNTRANHITFVGRLDPKSGKAEAGMVLLARLSDGKGNTIRPRGLAADESGRVYVGGASASYPPESANAFGGDFEGGGAFFCVFDPNFKRLYATKFCSGTTLAIAVGNKSVLAVGDGKANLLTVNPLQAEPLGGESDGWAVMFAEKP